MFRDARRADLPEFIQLWTEFIEELALVGGEFVADENTLRDVRNLFDAYVNGALNGVVVLYEPPGETPQGVGFIGETRGGPAIRGHSVGRVAHGWGIYIRTPHRKQHIAKGLQENIGKKLYRLGFDTISFTILTDNQAGAASAECVGMKPHAVVYHQKLEDWHNGKLQRSKHNHNSEEEEHLRV